MKLMKRLAGAAISFSLIAGVLAGCGEKKEELNIYSWADNFDEQVLRDFEKKFKLTGTPRFADKMQWSPFHWRCRTTIVLYSEDFDFGLTQEFREASRKEIDRRKKKE